MELYSRLVEKRWVMYIKRMLEATVKSLSEKFPVIVVSGARQVGKSTMLRMIKSDDMKYVTLDDYDAKNLALTDPKYFLEQYSPPVLIDEIQYAPNLLPYIKMIVDEKRLDALKRNEKLKPLFWLTGSQQFSLMKNVSESLAGRVGLLNLFSLSLDETENRTTDVFTPEIDVLKGKHVSAVKNIGELFTVIFNGGMPSVATNTIDRNSFYSSYIATYLERDVKQLFNVGKTMEFYNFLQYIAVRTAQEVNYSSMSKDVGVDQKTVKSWISILESSGIVFLLQPYFANLSSRIIKAPKLYFTDTGLASYLAKYPTAETLENGALNGAIFETFVVSEIVKNLTAHGVDPKGKLYYYRDKDQKEIDLIFCDGETLYPIEIKKGVSPANPDKNFKVLNKLSKNVGVGLVLCATDKLTPINKNCWLCPIDYI